MSVWQCNIGNPSINKERNAMKHERWLKWIKEYSIGKRQQPPGGWCER